MDRRKEELEKKRQKLAELRRAREERRALLESQSTQSSSVSYNKTRCTCVCLITSCITDHDDNLKYWKR